MSSSRPRTPRPSCSWWPELKLAVTGASGLLGGNVAALARARGDQVVCTRRATSRTGHLDGLDLQWVEADLAQPEALARAFEGADAVIHCAASTSLRRHPTPDVVAANVVGTQNVLDAVRMAGAGRLIHTSSTVAVGVSTDGRPCDEQTAYNFDAFGLDDGYSQTKRESEQRVVAAVADGLDAVIVNPGFMFGPYDAKLSSGEMIVEVVRGRAFAASTGSNSFVDVRDVAAGMLAAIDAGRAGERYILAGENLSYVEIFAKIATIAGKAPPRLVLPRWAVAPIGWGGDLLEAITGREQVLSTIKLGWGYQPGFIFSSDKARAELGYRTRPVDEGITAALSWLRENGRL